MVVGGGVFDHIVENLIIVFLMTDHTRHFGVQNMVLNLFVEHFGSFSVLKLNSSKIFIFSYFSSVRVARNNLISASTRLTLKRSSTCWKRRNRSSTLKEEKSEGTSHSIFLSFFRGCLGFFGVGFINFVWFPSTHFGYKRSFLNFKNLSKNHFFKR